MAAVSICVTFSCFFINHAPYAMDCFEDNNVIIPLAVIEELDGLKTADGDKGASAREAIRNMERYRTQGDLFQGISLEKGGILKIEANCVHAELQEALMQPAGKAPLVIVKGMAGTAKTFYSLVVGLERIYNNLTGEYRRILVTRPNAQFDSDIGFLPGDEQEKISPLMRPIIDNLEQIIDSYEDERYADEAQNMTPSQIKGIITRAGKGTKIVILGAPNQIDNSFVNERTNGLAMCLNL